jgi:hypothetical protein
VRRVLRLIERSIDKRGQVLIAPELLSRTLVPRVPVT